MTKATCAAAAAGFALACCVGFSAYAAPWDGAYVGLQVGDAFGDADQPAATTIGGPFTSAQADADLSSLYGGAHAGFDFPILDQFVAGILADYNFVSLKGDDGGTGPDGSDAGVTADVNRLKIDDIITARARLGWRFTPGSMLYATGGGAWMSGGATAPAEAISVDFSGYTYGAGLEFAIGEDATFGIEWRRIDVDRERVSFPVTGYDIGIKPDLDTVQIHLNYYLNSLFE